MTCKLLVITKVVAARIGLLQVVTRVVTGHDMLSFGMMRVIMVKTWLLWVVAQLL